MDGRTISSDGYERPHPPRSFPPHASAFAPQWIDALGGRGFRIRAAVAQDERASASSLIQRMYGGRGYTAHALPDKACAKLLTLVASVANTVIGTMTVGFDSKQGLAVDEVFPEEVGAIRASGRQICEFTKLAVDGAIRSQKFLAAMFHVAFIYAHRVRGCDNLLIEVNPRHVRYYEGKLGFKVLTVSRQNPRVGAAAVLLSLDLWHAQTQIDLFGGRPELAATERSLYPHALARELHAEVADRLLRGSDMLANVRSAAMT